jgi:hypothetical protein
LKNKVSANKFSLTHAGKWGLPFTPKLLDQKG